MKAPTRAHVRIGTLGDHCDDSLCVVLVAGKCRLTTAAPRCTGECRELDSTVHRVECASPPAGEVAGASNLASSQSLNPAQQPQTPSPISPGGDGTGRLVPEKVADGKGLGRSGRRLEEEAEKEVRAPGI